VDADDPANGRSGRVVVILFVKVGSIPSSWIRYKRWCGAWYRWALRHAKALHHRGHMTQTCGLELAGPFRSAFRRELFR
jgi:hypothetical protein